MAEAGSMGQTGRTVPYPKGLLFGMAPRCKYDASFRNYLGADSRQMTNGNPLCLNIISKNEMANFERFPGAIAEHSDCWVMGDSSSSDGGQSFIRSFSAACGMSVEPHEVPFHSFGEARNEHLSTEELA